MNFFANTFRKIIMNANSRARYILLKSSLIIDSKLITIAKINMAKIMLRVSLCFMGNPNRSFI